MTNRQEEKVPGRRGDADPEGNSTNKERVTIANLVQSNYRADDLKLPQFSSNYRTLF